MELQLVIPQCLMAPMSLSTEDGVPLYDQILYLCLKEHSAFHSHSIQSEAPRPTDSAVTLGDALISF